MDYNSVVAAARKYLAATGNALPVVDTVKPEGDMWIALCSVSFGARLKKLVFNNAGEVVEYSDVTPSR